MLRLRTCTSYLFLYFSLQEELQRKIQLRGILQNLKTLNTKSSTIRDDAKARSKKFCCMFLKFIHISLQIPTPISTVSLVLIIPSIFQRSSGYQGRWRTSQTSYLRIGGNLGTAAKSGRQPSGSSGLKWSAAGGIRNWQFSMRRRPKSGF